MPTIRRLAEFDDWIRGLRDLRARAKITIRVDRLAVGNPGKVNAVGEGVSELKIDYGPGYRVYYKPRSTRTSSSCSAAATRTRSRLISPVPRRWPERSDRA